MRSEQVFSELTSQDGRKVVLRTPRRKDLDDLLELVDSPVDEGAETYRDGKASRDEKIDWLSAVLARLERDNTFFLVAEVDGRIIASSDIKRQEKYQKHVGVIGSVIKEVLPVWASELQQG